MPLEALVTLEPDVTPADIEQLVTATGYSRFPVRAADHRSTGANLIGYIHLADVLKPTRRPGTGRWTAAVFAH